eukprot:3078608-Heterocapsa_arctica.AAC.1
MQADYRTGWNLQLPAHLRRLRQKQDDEKKRGADKKFKIKTGLTIRGDQYCDKLNKETESPTADK